MKWDRGHSSPDVVDDRGRSGGGGLGGQGALALIFLIARSPLGWAGALVAAAGIALYSFFSSAVEPKRSVMPEKQDEPKQFVAFVLDDVQGAWERTFAAEGQRYRHAKLVLFSRAADTACGHGSSASGPFYCPGDERVYIDLAFYGELEKRLGAGGDFAQAYVIAHEIGHHVQKLRGTMRGNRPSQGAEGSSVRLELQADCFAGIWARSTKQRSLLEKGDIEEAMNAAAAIGDDKLQRDATGSVRPEKWTHGSSAQRARWFKRGMERGSFEACDTFAEDRL